MELTGPEFDPETHTEIDPEDLQPRAWVPPERGRVLLVAGILLSLALLVVLPPLISANRFRRQIAGGISASLGRPVHMDSVTLTVLPLPGFTLENFVVAEDPAFGAEPVIQARTVRVTLRVWSLWRRRVEFSRISLTDPSVNLVHRADGRWNLESILLQASRMEAAPTAQKGAGASPRFPYIEATGARVNVKMGLEKMPLALTEADFALWLPQPQQWRLRLEGHPARTDTAATATGSVRIEGSLGKAAAMKDVPVDLAAEWTAAPMGGVSWVLMGRDAGLRGDLTLRTTVRGTVGENAIESQLNVTGLRRADFVPARTLDVNVTCTAQATGVFHRLSEVRCGFPPAMLANPKSGLLVQAEVPEVSQPRVFSADGTINGVAAATLLDALRVVSPRISPDLSVAGTLSAKVVCCDPASGGWQATAGRIAMEKAQLAAAGAKPFVDADLGAELSAGAVAVQPFALDLGAAQPATLEVRVDRTGCQMHLSGAALRSRLMLLASALPQFGDGLEEALPAAAEGAETPMRLDMNATRTWAGGQKWASVPLVRPGRPRTRRR